MTTAKEPPVITSGPSSAWRYLYLVAAMRGVTFFGDIAAATAIELSLQGRGYSGAAVAGVLLAAILPPILLGPLSGRIVDKYPKAKVLTVAATVQLMLGAGTLLTDSPVIWTALILGIGCGVAFAHPVFGSMPSQLMPRKDQPRAASISQMSAMAGMLSAPAVGALLASQFGTHGALALNVVAFAFVVVGALTLSRHPASRTSAKTDAAAAASHTDSYSVWSDAALRSILAANGVLMLCASTINVFVVFFVRDTLDASERMYGLVGSAWMAGLIPGALLVSKVRIPMEQTLLASFAFVGIGILLTAAAPSAWWVLPFYFLGGLGNGAGATATHVLLNTRVPENHRGRAFAALGMVSNSGPSLGILLGGLFLAVADPRTGYLVAGLAVLIALAFVARRVLAMGSPAAAEAAARKGDGYVSSE